jgi:hypothetical protein
MYVISNPVEIPPYGNKIPSFDYNISKITGIYPPTKET